MHKDFDGWNDIKKKIDSRLSTPFYHEREVWWCALGLNVGSEQNGSSGEYRRPIIVLRGLGRETCLVIPLTTSKQTHSFRPGVGLIDGKGASALISQMRVIDTRRLVRKIGMLNKETFERIRKTARDLL
jgi:mRNA interferase MazF